VQLGQGRRSTGEGRLRVALRRRGALRIAPLTTPREQRGADEDARNGSHFEVKGWQARGFVL